MDLVEIAVTGSLRRHLRRPSFGNLTGPSALPPRYWYSEVAVPLQERAPAALVSCLLSAALHAAKV
jgi:hypothetical protein